MKPKFDNKNDHQFIERTPGWIRQDANIGPVSGGGAMSRGGSSTASDMSIDPIRPPTPPLHRFPSWEAKIYQVHIDKRIYSMIFIILLSKMGFFN